jgi:hypothetical protein
MASSSVGEGADSATSGPTVPAMRAVAPSPIDEEWLTEIRYLNSTVDPLVSGLMSSLLPTLGTPFLSTTKSM